MILVVVLIRRESTNEHSKAEKRQKGKCKLVQRPHSIAAANDSGMSVNQQRFEIKWAVERANKTLFENRNCFRIISCFSVKNSVRIGKICFLLKKLYLVILSYIPAPNSIFIIFRIMIKFLFFFTNQGIPKISLFYDPKVWFLTKESFLSDIWCLDCLILSLSPWILDSRAKETNSRKSHESHSRPRYRCL